MRSRLELIADILSIATQPVNSTTIVYGVHLSNQQFKIYIGYMQDRRLIERTNNNSWLTTDKGRSFLLAFSDLTRVFETAPTERSAIISPILERNEKGR